MECNVIDMGARIKELREAAGLTQDALAKEMLVQRGTVNYWEKGSRPIKAEDVVSLANRFGVTCDFILSGVKAKNTALHRDLGLSDAAIEVLRASVQVLNGSKASATSEEEWVLQFINKDRPEDAEFFSVTSIRAKHTIDCINALLEDSGGDYELRLIDQIVTYLYCEIHELEPFVAKSKIPDMHARNPELFGRVLKALSLPFRDATTRKESIQIMGKDILISKLFQIQQSLIRLRAKLLSIDEPPPDVF